MPRFSRNSFILPGIFLVILLAGWLYWPTLRLPLIYDTLLHIRIAGGLTLGTVWLPTEAFGFYRPMTFFPMLVIQQLFDGYPAWLLHGNNVVQHAANAGLLVWLSWRLWPDWRRALAAGAVFALFPFSYQAVAVYGHNVHPAIVGLMLLGLHTYLTAVSAQSPRKWWLVTWLLFALMLLTHETAVLFGGFALLIQLNARPDLLKQPRLLLRQPWRWFLLAGLAYLVLYQFLPISRAPQTDAVGNSLWLNGLYLLQAAVYPLTWFAHLLPNGVGVPLTLLGGGLLIMSSGWLAWRKPAWRAPLLLAWGWWGAASVLIGAALPTEYLLRGPRLLYVGSVGVALLWAHLLAGIWSAQSASGSRYRWLGWTAVLLFILITSGQFVRTKLQQYALLTQPVPVMQAALRQGPDSADAEFVLVNLPQWLDVPPNTYPIGVEFVAMLGDYLFAEELVAANLPGSHAVWAVALPELQSGQSYAYGIQDQHRWPEVSASDVRHVVITRYLPDGPKAQHAGYLLPETAVPPENPIAQFEPYLLTNATAELCSGVVQVTLGWLPNRAAIAESTSIFVQVLAEDGRLLAQSDGPPLGIRPGLLPASPNTLLVDLREVNLAAGETAVPQTVLVGVYDFATGARSPATDVFGQPLPDNAWQIPILPCG